MAAILDLGQNEDLPWVDSGGLFLLFLHTSNEIISGEKPLLTFLSNPNRSLLRLLYHKRSLIIVHCVIQQKPQMCYLQTWSPVDLVAVDISCHNK